VDDEVTLRAMLSMILGRLGFIVTSAGQADEALALLAARPRGFDVVVTDHVLPGASGVELAAQIEARCPGLPVLLLSGESVSHFEAAERERFAAILSKPAEAKELAQAIVDAVQRARERSPDSTQGEAR
jgi:DNA-binding NtrC family response regulator